MAWRLPFARSRVSPNPHDEPDNVPERNFERVGQVDMRPQHARASAIVQVEALAGAALGPDGYMHPLQEDDGGNLYVIDGKQLLLETNRNLRLIVYLLAKLTDTDDPFEIDLEQDDTYGE